MKKFMTILLASSGIFLFGAELNSGNLRVELRKNATAPQKISYNGMELIQNFFYSWYARGYWYSDRSGVSNSFDRSGTGNIKVEKLSTDSLTVKYDCTDFNVAASYELLKDPDAVKVEFYLTARNDIYLGGIDPPGGCSLPLIRKNKALTHFYEVAPDLSVKLKSRGDYPERLAGVVRNNCIGGYTDAKGEKGFFFLLDRRFYGRQQDTPVITGGGLCFSKDVCKLIRKGEIIKGQFYIIPFDGNAEKTARTAVEKFCDPDPAERWDFYAPYRELVKKTASSFVTVADNEFFTAAAGSTGHVLPETPLPKITAPSIKVSGAKNQHIFAQIVLNAKQDLKDLKFTLEFPEFKDCRIEKITPAPSDYPATAFAVAGDFPDILQKADTPELKKSSGNVPYLLTIYIPENAQAGTRTGKVKIFSGEKSIAELNVEIEVFDFALPKMSSFRSAFLAWTSAAYRKNFRTKDYMLDQRKLRITTPVEIYTPCDKQGNLNSPDGFKRAVKNALDAGDTCFRLSSVYMWRSMPYKDKTGKEAELYIKTFTRQVYDIMKELNAVKYAWFLMADETHRPEMNKMHAQWCKWVREVAPDLPIFSTQNHPEHSIADQADILCGPLSSVNVLCKKYGDKKEYWVYENDYPFSLGQSEIVTRSMPLRSMKHGIKGYHQWSSCHWPAEKNSKFRPGYFHGTASLYYPPEFGYRKNQPVRSMRLINCAQGIIDHDHIAILEKLIAENPTLQEAQDAAKYLKRELDRLVPDVYNFNGSSADFDVFRLEIAHWIVKISNSLSH